jgi:hypothetical protein
MPRSHLAHVLQDPPIGSSRDSVSELTELVRLVRADRWPEAHSDPSTLATSLVIAAEDALAACEAEQDRRDPAALEAALGEIAVLLLSFVHLRGGTLADLIEQRIGPQPTEPWRSP